MLDALIRQAEQFGLGTNARRFIGLIAGSIFSDRLGGFDGFRERFEQAGLGSLLQSWIGTTPSDNVLQPDQFSVGFGQQESSRIAHLLGVPPATVNLAGAAILPKLVGMLTSGGIPAGIPAQFASLLGSPVTRAPQARASGIPGWVKWGVPLLILLGLLLFAGLKFAFDGDKLNIDTSALPEDQRFAITGKLRSAFGGYAITGLWDRATAALAGLKAGFSADDLVKALNLMNVYFETDSATITADSMEVLQRASEAIKAAPAGSHIEIGGHTDNTGDVAGNATLSQQRADAVMARLGRMGVGDGILTAKGYGQDKPIADNGTEEGRASNRRIEFNVLK